MRSIPCDERAVTDEEVFSAFNLNYPGLEEVRAALDSKDMRNAKKELVHYFEIRSNVHYYYDYRKHPLTPVETDDNPYLFQSSMGLQGSLKDFCLFAGRKMMQHIYVRPGRERRELDLGEHYENLPHFNFYEDQGKKHRTVLDIFVRGVFMEYLGILYQETGDRSVVAFTEEFLQVFWENYPLIVACTAPDSSHFSKTEERDVMSVGWLILNYITLLYTRLPYEADMDVAFEIISHIWFLGMQFRRFDTDTYRKYNHHMWERGLMPFILGTLFPEIPDFAEMKAAGAEVVRRHIRDDFNEEGGYSEHTIPYWCGAALGEMICRGVFLSRLNGESLLDRDTFGRISRSFDILALISAPGDCYPSLGDNGGTLIDPVLRAGVEAVENRFCKKVLEHRRGRNQYKHEMPGVTVGNVQDYEIPLDYCSDKTGFFCSRSSLDPDANYLLMSAKVNCGDTGHNHMDLLSLFISIHGQEFIGEPYARELYHTIPVGNDLRGYLYNMESHNTVLAFGAPIQPDRFFSSKWGVLRPDTPVAAYASEKGGCFVKAYHDAYTHSRHVRKVLSCRQRGFLIRDELIGGDRLPVASIQRWHLFPDVKCGKTVGNTLLLEKNGAKALLVWSGSPSLRFWQKKELYPSIVRDEKKIATIIDIAIMADSFSPVGRYDAVTQDLLILDVTEGSPAVENVDVFCRELMELAEKGRLAEALERFERLA